MAEYNKQRFFWIKLSDRFMTSDTVDYIMSQKDGANYIVIYQMLCLKTVNNDGCLSRTLGEIIVPYDEEKIQRDLKWFSIDTIRVAIHLYRQLGLVYEQDNGILKITDFDNMVGSQTISAAKKQEQLKNRGGKKVEKIPPDIDIEKEKDKDIEKDKENKSSPLNSSPQRVENENPLSGVPQDRIKIYGIAEFLNDNPHIMIDENYCGGTIDDIPFAEINRCIKESHYLQGIENFSFFTRHYKGVIAGKYKDSSKKPSDKNKKKEEPEIDYDDYECLRV